eukprot:CAMPEP_0194299168 /NCGR_PEP_ID=MMETSP0169-20130528/60572_1 /TAXON_ID=218684 /ORGANISM="Corethron pennatum, Strain L29A3" /LENGTH=130 /DNA_ID=CAMNT_0039049239 /DNA_START=519 /DNA_END=911 /DNA_ORIENTATION=+
MIFPLITERHAAQTLGGARTARGTLEPRRQLLQRARAQRTTGAEQRVDVLARRRVVDGVRPVPGHVLEALHDRVVVPRFGEAPQERGLERGVAGGPVGGAFEGLQGEVPEGFRQALGERSRRVREGRVGG